MAILKSDSIICFCGVPVHHYLLTSHNPNHIDMPSGSMDGRVIGVTIHNTDWINVAAGTTPAEQYTRATVNGNMEDVRVHYYVDDVCAWQNLPLTLPGWHAADGDGDGNRRTIAIECIMSPGRTDRDKKSEDNCARLAAALLKQYGFGADKLYTHNHWYNKKYCPAYILPHWNDFVEKVKGYLNADQPKQETVKKMYRIRKTWIDAKSQVGAFKNIDRAKESCPTGYSVFDESGTIVYSNVPKPIEAVTKPVESGSAISFEQLSKGSKGKSVKILQALLIAAGYSCGPYKNDGDFGGSTEAAVRNYQRENGLSDDGIAGPKTWNSLLS